MATLRKLVVLFVVLGAIGRAADPSLLNLVMPDAQVLFGANVEGILSSQIGKQISSQIHSKLPQLQQVTQKAGFDPTRNLQEVLIAVSGGGETAKALILARGSFDAEKIQAAVASGTRTRQTYQGVQILVNPAQTNGAFAFLDGSIAVGGDLDQVQAAIRRRSHPAALNAQLASRVAAVSNQYDLWIVSATSLSGMADNISSPRLKQMGDLLKAVEQVSGGARFTDNLDLGVDLTTHDEKDAERLRDALQLLIGMAAASQRDASALDLKALKLTAEQNAVHIAFTITGDQLKKTYELQMARLQESAKPARPAAPESGITIQSSERDMGTVVVTSK